MSSMGRDLLSEPTSRLRSWLRKWASSSVVLLPLLVATTLGCSRSSKEFTPPADQAESALRAGLDAWKAGDPSGEVAGVKPAVHVVDMNRKPGQRLVSYTVLGEKPVSSGRTFAVQLEFAEPAETAKASYHIVGIDPLWVFRQEDYELLSHWDHYMPAEPSESEEPDAPASRSQIVEPPRSEPPPTEEPSVSTPVADEDKGS